MTEIYIPWEKVKDQDPEWSEICVKVVERFGVPGDRYTSHLKDDHMLFKFKDEQDYLMCKLLLSEYVQERNKWILTVNEYGMLVFPPELMAKVGWKEGDTLDWQNNDDGSWTLTKVDR